MAEPDDRVTVTLTLRNDPLENDGADEKEAVLTVLSVHRRVPGWVRLSLGVPAPKDDPDGTRHPRPPRKRMSRR